jgi:hypothetical protein
MLRRKFLKAFAGGVAGLAALNQAFAQAGWLIYRSDHYGFQMLLPHGASLREREWPAGWSGLQGTYQGVEFSALTQQGRFATPDEIESYGERVTGIEWFRWEKLDEGVGANGWNWYRLYRTFHRANVLYGGLGVGPRGSYLLLLRTTPDDDARYAGDYRRWYESLRVF